MSKSPPFTITRKILSLSGEISRKLGLLEGLRIDPAPIKLRKDNQIKTIQASLSIEGNSLALDQVQSILEGKTVLAPRKDIIEVKNAIDLYKNLSDLDPLSIRAFKQAHKILMVNLISSNGTYREKGVGIFKGKEIAHVAPPARRVPELMQDLFNFLKQDSECAWLIKACIFHYELEFIHPFADGNGRMGRLWQQLLLMKEDPIFEYLSVEALIKATQSEYYLVLAQCDKEAESTKFIEYSLQLISGVLDAHIDTISGTPMDTDARLNYARSKFKSTWFSRKDYIQEHKNISTATASRDLCHGLESMVLEKIGDKNKTRYRFILGAVNDRDIRHLG